MQSTNKSKHLIDLDKAVKMTGKYRRKRKEIEEGKIKGKAVLPICETFDRNGFDALLSEPGCTGIRIYFSMDDKDEVNLVIVGVNEKGQDMLPAAEGDSLRTSDPVILDNGTRCPEDCPEPSPLNS